MTRAALTTLRYWNPGPFADTVGDDPEAHFAAGYNGLVECLDGGLLEHVSAADVYKPTARGLVVLGERGEA